MSFSDFQRIKQIGKGAFGIVYLVRRNKDKIIYALKQVQISKMSSKEKSNALNEIRILASITHKNIISYKECFFDDKTQSLNLVMEYADDGDLSSKIQSHLKAKLYFYENEIWSILIQMVRGLKALHDMKIMHRDLKSANIFLMKNGLCKLGDMNVSKEAKMDMLHTQTGTPYYASPEVWSRLSYDYKSDIWSIGCILYELCCLNLPFLGKKIEDVYSNVVKANYKPIPSCYSSDLANIIDLILKVNPQQRLDCDGLLNHPIVFSKYNELNLLDSYSIKEKGDEVDKENNRLIASIHFKVMNDLKKVLPKSKKYNSNNNVRATKRNSNTIKRPESSNIQNSKKHTIIRSRSSSQVKANNNTDINKNIREPEPDTSLRLNRSKTPCNKIKRNIINTAKTKTKTNVITTQIQESNISLPINRHYSNQCNKYTTPHKNQIPNNSVQSTNPNSKCSNKKARQTKETSNEDREELSHVLIEKQDLDMKNIIEEKISLTSSKSNERPQSCGMRKAPLSHYQCIDQSKHALINPIKIIERHNLKHFIPSHMQIKLKTIYMFKKNALTNI